MLKAAEIMLARMRAKPGKTIRNRRELKRTLASYIPADLFSKLAITEVTLRNNVQ